MNDEKIPKKFLNMKVKEKMQEGDRDQNGHSRLGNTSHRRKKDNGKKLRETEIEGEAWLSDDSLKVKTS
jgi:hypothetical protein